MSMGPPIKKAAGVVPDEWQPVRDKPHLEINSKGQLRTKIEPPPVEAVWPFNQNPKPP